MMSESEGVRSLHSPVTTNMVSFGGLGWHQDIRTDLQNFFKAEGMVK